MGHRQRGAVFDFRAVFDDRRHILAELVLELAHLSGDDSKAVLVLFLQDLDGAVEIAHDRHPLGHPCLKELLNARKSLHDVRAGGDASQVKRAHSELGGRFTHRLRGDDAHRRAFLDRLMPGKVHAIARLADSALIEAVGDGSHVNGLDLDFVDKAGRFTVDYRAAGHDDFARVRMGHRVDYEPAEAANATDSITSSAAPARTHVPSVAPQSCPITITSCATSTSRRVR